LYLLNILDISESSKNTDTWRSC